MKGSHKVRSRNHFRSPPIHDLIPFPDPLRMGCNLPESANTGNMTAVATASRMVMRMVTVMCCSVRNSSLVRMKLIPQKTVLNIRTMYVMVFCMYLERIVNAEICDNLIEAPVWRAPAQVATIARVVERYGEVDAQGGNRYIYPQSKP